ncbi:hypothetical protein OHD25_01735 [Escherichia coli]|nr:hypothetical protein [Escherichia coli]
MAESPTWAPYFDFTGVQLTWMLVGFLVCGGGAAGVVATGPA